jgi:antitoxin VapB
MIGVTAVSGWLALSPGPRLRLRPSSGGPGPSPPTRYVFRPCRPSRSLVYTSYIYFLNRWSREVGDIETAKLFKHGGSQAVRLPKDFRMPGTEVRVRRLGRGVLLEPIERSVEDIKAVFAEIDRLGSNEFLPEGRPQQPTMPAAHDVSFDR